MVTLEMERNSRHVGATWKRRVTIAAGLLAGASIILVLLVWPFPEAFGPLSDAKVLAGLFDRVGPVAVVFLLAVAVVLSPIPSGPIAMAAGAIYGPFLGGSLTALGALLGATCAFGLSRRFGYRPLSSMNSPLAAFVTRKRSQRKLAFVILVTRLIPFISFDAISYLAGLTSIRSGYFVLATALGVLPVSFAFAALGAGAAAWDSRAVLIGACAITLIVPAALLVLRRLRATPH